MKTFSTEEELIQIWNMTYNLSLRMLLNEEDARDATQSIFEIVTRKIGQFRHDSKLSTWVYRISHNYLVDEKRKQKHEPITFELFEKDVRNFRKYENEFNLSPEEEKMYAEEVKIGCTKALLQCLDRESRFIFILGTIFSTPRKEAAEICGLTHGNYRAKLSRSKEKIRNFMSKNCGLLNPQAECKCRKRLLIASERGRINLEKVLHRTESRRIKDYISELNQMDELSNIYRDNPFEEDDREEISRKIRQLEIVQEISQIPI